MGKIVCFWKSCLFIEKLSVYRKVVCFWKSCPFLEILSVFGKVVCFSDIHIFLKKKTQKTQENDFLTKLNK